MRYQMKQHEREYFIARIRTGLYHIKDKGRMIVVRTPNIKENYFIERAFFEQYEKCLNEGVPTTEDLLEQMDKRGLWTEEDEQKTKGFQEDIENLQVKCYKSRFDHGKRKVLKKILKSGKEQLFNHLSKKQQFIDNTCEGIAHVKKLIETIKTCSSYEDGTDIDFQSVSPESIVYTLNDLYLSEEQIRDLARNEPWKQLWILNESKIGRLFDNTDYELTHDQNHILIWARMYDSVFESMETPPDDVFEDDDMLDGWFVIQKRKRERDQAEAEVNSLSDKHGGAGEVFVMAKTQQDADRVHEANSTHAKEVKKQRAKVMQEKGTAKDTDFLDQRVRLQEQSNQMYKDKFRR